MTSQASAEYLALSADIVAAFVSKNSIPAAELPGLIETVYASLQKINEGTPEAPPVEVKEPAVSIRKSVGTDFIICLEDGKKFKSLKRHLSTHYGLSPEQYREKWKLPSDYPMVAPAYAAQRSELAKKIGLGARKDPAAVAKDTDAAPVKKAGRGRPTKAAA
jgi:predicted transcriptional regulator